MIFVGSTKSKITKNENGENVQNIKKSYKNNKFKISTPKWNEEFEFSDGSYSIRIYINKIENRITFKIKTGYYF